MISKPTGRVERWLFWHATASRKDGVPIKAATWFEARALAAVQLGCSPFVLRGERAQEKVSP